MPGNQRGEPRPDPASERGQTMAEYAIITSVIAVGVVASLTALGNPVLQLIQNASDVIGSLV